jgi:GDP/UDP-N,N'-diacetylbacillosamine 2-epimerase (hydrolysing)
VEIAILTSSRADYGFYKPLLNFSKKGKVKFHLVVFGTHLSKKHGHTIDQIKEDGMTIYESIKTPIKGDSPADIADCMGVVHQRFAQFWNKHSFDYILCLGDRYEMYAAVSASVPFNISVIHLSGGEETKGAIDNYYRHALSLMAKIHFTNTAKNAKRVAEIIGSKKNIYHTGSLAIDNINASKLMSAKAFQAQFHFNINQLFYLFTFHPETVNYQANAKYAKELFHFLKVIDTAILVTMPNADTAGNIIREVLVNVAKENAKITLVESLGSLGYYTAMKHCALVIGNSSSGIVEAASFNKYVINLGSRQAGREKGKNIIDLPIVKVQIEKAIGQIKAKSKAEIKNIYGDGKAAMLMMTILNSIKTK